MNILVTGGAGFIGSHVVDHFLREGHRVVVLDNLSTGKKEYLNPEATFYEMDIMDPQVKGIFEKENIQIINHHAAQISVTQSVANPLFDAEINVIGSLKLLKLAIDFKVDKFIFASTGGALYGEQEYYPAREDHPCRPLSPYGIAKFSVENYIRFYKQTHGLNAAVLRYSNVYGPRQDPHGEAGVVAIFCQKLIRDEVPIIFGDGKQTRDFVSVSDVAQANLAALTSDCEDTYNVGTGKETSVNQMVECLVKLADKKIDPRYDPPRKGEQLRSVIDYKKINSACGWEPRTALEDGLKDTYRFFSDQAKNRT